MTSDERLVAQGERLREMREKFSRSPMEVASYLKFGNRQTVYDLEAGRRDMKAYEAMQLADYYRVSPEALLGGTYSEGQGVADINAENLLQTMLNRIERLFSFQAVRLVV